MKITSFLLVLVLISSSCSIIPIEQPKSTQEFVSDDKTPYATIQELELLSSNNDNIHHKVSRILVLQDVLSEEVGESLELSDTPVIIYGLDGKAQYYEYRLTKGGNAYKSYSIPVLKHQGVGVVVKLDIANNYSAQNRGMKVIAPMYPSRYGLVNTLNKSSIVKQQFYIPNMEQNVALSELMSGTEIGARIVDSSAKNIVDNTLEDLLIADMDDPNFWTALEEFSNPSQQGDSYIQEAHQNYKDHKQHNIEIYNKMEAEMQSIITLSQEEAEQQLLEEKENYDKSNPTRAGAWYGHRYAHAYKIHKKDIFNYWLKIKNLYSSNLNTREDWNSTWCGPVAVAMILFGYHHKGKVTTESTTEVSTNEYLLAKQQTNYSDYFRRASIANSADGAVSMTFLEFRKVFRQHGGNVEYGNGAIWYNKTAEKAFKHIENGNPVLFHVPEHWVFAYEANSQKRTRGWWIFKWTETYRNFRMTDNGSDGKKHSENTWWMGESHTALIWMHPVVLP